jgi:catechol 2,3-dioxygenase-like lactoylglutathione lyase family enzyme
MITGGNATVYVSDMERAVTFYTHTLGLDLQQRWGDHWAAIQAGPGLAIGLHPRTDKTPNAAIALGFSIDVPIDEAVQRLAARGVRFRGPVVRDAKGGIALAFFGDPDGNELYLCQSITSS